MAYLILRFARQWWKQKFCWHTGPYRTAQRPPAGRVTVTCFKCGKTRTL